MWAKIKNILWLNLKKMRVHAFWRILYISINFMLFFSASLTLADGTFLDPGLILFIFILASLANILFLYAKMHSEQNAISLLRSMGASRLFIIIDYETENVLQFIIALIFFSFSLFIKPANLKYFLITQLELVVIVLSTLILSLLHIRKTEKMLRIK